MVAIRGLRPQREGFGPDHNTLKIKRWLEEDTIHRTVLHDWMQRNGLEKQALVHILYATTGKSTRERIAGHFLLH